MKSISNRLDDLSRRARRSAALVAFASLTGLLAAGCVTEIDPGGDGSTDVPDDDPLAVPADVEAGTLEALHKNVVLRSCAAQPGLCHHGQFEPNLSTPALTYENLVLKPGIEHDKQYRVDPGSPGDSLLIDKLRNQDVLSQMPLGADPLAEEEIAAFEKWIMEGALRRPGAAPAPKLNNPPAEPQIGIFDSAGNRLDGAGSFSIAAGTALVLRHSVQDFETADGAIPFATFVIQLADGRSLKLSDNPDSPNTGVTAYEANGAPEGQGDLLNYRFDWTVPAMADVIGGDGQITQEDITGKSLTVLAAYIDSATPNEGMLTFVIEPDLVKVTP